MFIKNVFIPEKIGTYYIFAKTIAAFEITKTNIYVSVVVAKGRSTIIEKFIDVPLNNGSTQDYNERVIQGLKAASAQIPKSSHIYCAIPSAQALLKELRLPFIGRDKIAMLVNYEVEPLLPFALSDAVIDFVITRENQEEKNSEVLVIAVQKQFILQYNTLFEAAGLKPELVTLDMLGLYSLFCQTPTYIGKKDGTIVLEIEHYQTRIGFISDGILRALRTLPKGLQDIAQAASKRLMIEPHAIIEHMQRVGLVQEENPEHQKIYQEEFSRFISEVSLTIQAFTRQVQPPQTIGQMILFGPCTAINGLTELLSESLGITTTKWDTGQFISTQAITLKTKQPTIPQTHLITVGTAIADPRMQAFNLRTNGLGSERRDLLFFLIINSILSIAILLTLLISSYIKIIRIRSEVKQAEQETIEALRERFKKIPEELTTLDDVLEEAQKEVDREERLWLAFSGYGRDSILRYLFELTSIIDRQSLGMVIERITISEDTITLKASVRGFEELKTLVRDLRQSKLFSYVEPQNDRNFTMVIRLKKQITG